MSNDIEHSSGYEKTDIDPKQIIIFGILFIVFLVVSLVLLDDYFIYKKEQMYREMVLEPIDPEFLKLRAREDSVLNSYGIADTATGEYHMPIDSAMKQVAASAGGK